VAANGTVLAMPEKETYPLGALLNDCMLLWQLVPFSDCTLVPVTDYKGSNIVILGASFMDCEMGLRFIEKVNQESLLEGKTIRRGVLPL
jgi:hypothetical protein